MWRKVDCQFESTKLIVWSRAGEEVTQLFWDSCENLCRIEQGNGCQVSGDVKFKLTV